MAVLPLPVVAFSPPIPESRLLLVWRFCISKLSGTVPTDSLGEPTTTENTSDSGATIDRRRVPHDGGDLAEEDGMVDLVVVDNEDRPEEWKRRDGKEVKKDPEMDEKASSDRSSLYEPRQTRRDGYVTVCGKFLKGQLWPVLLNFFEVRRENLTARHMNGTDAVSPQPSYLKSETETAYQKELWYQNKSVALWGSAFMVVNTILNATLTPHPWSTWNMVADAILQPIFAAPLIPMCLWDVPHRHRWLWQGWIFCLVWVATSGFVLDIRLCGYYEAHPHCGNRDFTAVFFYATAIPVTAVFALGMKRICHLAGVIAWIILVGAAILPVRQKFSRTLVNWSLFQALILSFNFIREKQHRRMYTLRAELKIQYRAKQRAQIAERKTMDGRKRFSNYIFHEVRVPLNTSLLALQNLKADGVFNAMLAEGQPHSIEYSAIESSLRMMSQVLNDVLDFSRMERGGFSSVSRPFSLHGVLRSIASPLRLEAAAAGLALETSFDSRIDEFANLAAFKKPQAGFGLLIGDEMRLRQVVNNLTSNATKFTSPGGKVSLSTKLVHPWPDILPSIEEDSDEQVIVVRIEVTDTGVGIRSRDLHDGLFSAYVQTQIGLNQGGKGTGLGLSLVKQIVTNSGGRLGVRSQVGVGTTMWFELPFTVGRGTLKAEPIDLDEELAKGFKVNTPESYSDQKSEFDFPPPTPPAESQSLSGRTLVNTRPLVSGLFQSEGTSSGEERETSPSVSSSASPSTSQRSEIEHGIKPPLVTSASAPAPSSLVQPKKALSFEYGPVRALIVDDDNLTRKLMGRMVERLGCQVESAENGAIALDMILATEDEDNPNEEPKHFDIILLDNQMPICSGLQVVSKLRSLGRQDYIIGVTANAQLQDQEEFIREGASLVLTKPVREGDLRKVILLADQRRKPGGEE